MSEFNIEDLEAVIAVADSSLVQMMALQLRRELEDSAKLREQLEESQREFRSADITMQNLEAQLKQSKIDADCYKKGMEASNARLVQLAAENAGLKAGREQISEIGELIRTQDNRITDQPFFAVMTKREMITSEDHDYDRICWVENQSGDYVEATETQHRRLEAIYQGRYEVREGWDRFAMKEIDVFVTGCFTEHGCKEYIRQNGHNLNKPFIYAFGSYRNHEYQKVRKFIMGMPETPATDAYQAEVRAQGVEMFAAVLRRKGDDAFFDAIAEAQANAADQFAANLRKGVQS
ncbi:hypothetical protein [Citrobacter amalonaticus]|uniref:hypothetical protein n=1 Tax=Citrobacter amalonaticus TaxID=35703 RepID=UPI001E3B1160|nr:hypothetical protein [Citrobacter amalonaticus]